MKIPTRVEAEGFIEEAGKMNPGPWVEHSLYVAKAAEAIARTHPRLDAEAAFVMGILHDIGRREGIAGMRHVIDGYTFLMEKGFDEAARICLTHSYPTWHPHAAPEYGMARKRISLCPGVSSEEGSSMSTTS